MAIVRPIPHVALLIETSRSYSRSLLRGIKRYTDAHGPWSVYLELRHLDSKVPPWLNRWDGDGILTRTEHPATAKLIRKLGIPAVELRATHFKHDFPFVGNDNRETGRMVARHLLDCGFRQFAVYEIETQSYFAERRDHYVRLLKGLGHDVHVHHAAGRREKPLAWEREQNQLADWLIHLPKPVGVFACTDQLGFWLLDACRRAGLSVPEDVAVVGAEDDQTLCASSSPPLSSVRFNGEEIGHRAARLLDRMMRRRPAPKRPIHVRPVGVTRRQSSDVVAVDDPIVAKAVRFIREHACNGIRTDDVLARLPISRSSLERRMREALGRSPKAEILRHRMDRAKHLLRETDLTLERIAPRCGFPHAQHMAALFKKKTGETPGEYRRRFAAGAAY